MALVERILIHHIAKEFRKPMKSGIDLYSGCHIILIELEAEGLTGFGYCFVFTEHQARSIVEIVRDLAYCVLRQEVHKVREIWDQMWLRTYFIGQTGTAIMAMSVIETALWDAFAKESKLPLCRMLGIVRQEIPVYVTGGWLTQTGKELVEELEQYASMGYNAVKIKVGHRDFENDVERVKIVRSSLGDRFEIMVDANQAWDEKTAIRAGNKFGELGVKWLEEPISANNIEGMSRVTAAVDIPIAVGESSFNRHGLQMLVSRRCCDIIMPDMARCGGISEMRAVSSVAEMSRMLVSPHMFWEISVHVVATIGNGTGVEYLPGWFDDVIIGPPIVNGVVRVQDTPGLGIGLNREMINRLRVRECISIAK